MRNDETSQRNTHTGGTTTGRSWTVVSVRHTDKPITTAEASTTSATWWRHLCRSKLFYATTTRRHTHTHTRTRTDLKGGLVCCRGSTQGPRKDHTGTAQAPRKVVFGSPVLVERRVSKPQLKTVVVVAVVAGIGTEGVMTKNDDTNTSGGQDDGTSRGKNGFVTAQQQQQSHQQSQNHDSGERTTLPRFPVPAADNKNCWSVPEIGGFRVRGLNYLSDQKKVASGPYLLETRGCDLYLTEGDTGKIAK